MKKLIKIYNNKAVFLEDNRRIVVETIPDNSMKILNYYKNKIFLSKTLDII